MSILNVFFSFLKGDEKSHERGYILSLGCGEEPPVQWDDYADLQVPDKVKEMQRSGFSVTKTSMLLVEYISGHLKNQFFHGTSQLEKDIQGAKTLLCLLLQQVSTIYIYDPTLKQNSYNLLKTEQWQFYYTLTRTGKWLDGWHAFYCLGLIDMRRLWSMLQIQNEKS